MSLSVNADVPLNAPAEALTEVLFSAVSGVAVVADGKTTGVLGTVDTDLENAVGVKGRCGNAMGFLAGHDPQFKQHAGVYGQSEQQGVLGHSTSDTGTGVFGNSAGNGFGVRGETNDGIAVQGQSFGNGVGIKGIGTSGDGVQGATSSSAANGIFGRNDTTDLVPSGLPGGNGIFGFSMVPNASGVFGANNNGGNGVSGASPNGIGLHGSGRIAGRFEGDVEVTGDIRLVNADCAEDFDVIEDDIEPGTVMVLGDEGMLLQSRLAYDKRVAGVVSGAGNFKPGIILDKQSSSKLRQPIALLGKVYCKVDADYAAIEVGDLLTTSSTIGYAMKAEDPFKAFGAVIGKALNPLKSGKALVPILISLQ